MLGVTCLSVGASAFTGISRSAPTCRPRMLLPSAVHGSAPSQPSIRHDERQKYTDVYFWGDWGLGHLDAVASRRVWSPNFRSRICRSTALLAKPNLSEEEMAERKEQLRELLRATEAEIDKFVSYNPAILFRRGILEAYSPKLTMLRERLGISKKEASQLCLVAIRILTTSLGTLEGKIDWLQARLDLDKTQLREIIGRAPGTLTYSIEDNLGPSLEIIQSSLKLSDKELAKMIERKPALLQSNFSSKKLAVQLSLLRDLLNIEENDLASLRATILKRPEILYWSEESMLESQQWIKDRLGLEDARIAQMFRNVPNLLLLKVKTLEKKADWLQKELRLHDKELSKLISVKSQILTFSMEKKVRPPIKYLRRTFQLNDEEVKDLLLRSYYLFNFSIDKNLEPKLEFYSKLVGKAVAKEAMLEKRNCFKASLKTRLKPRLAEVEERGDRVRWTKTLLVRLATRTPAQWEAYGLGDAPRGVAAHSRKK